MLIADSLGYRVDSLSVIPTVITLLSETESKPNSQKTKAFHSWKTGVSLTRCQKTAALVTPSLETAPLPFFQTNIPYYNIPVPFAIRYPPTATGAAMAAPAATILPPVTVANIVPADCRADTAAIP